jgi:hypothetical protein
VKPSIRDLIPALIVFLFVACLAALLMELLIPAMAGRAADVGVITALSGMLSTCVGALIALYVRDTTRPPPPEEKGPDDFYVDESSVKMARELLRRSLDEIRAWPRWKLGPI